MKRFIVLLFVLMQGMCFGWAQDSNNTSFGDTEDIVAIDSSMTDVDSIAVVDAETNAENHSQNGHGEDSSHAHHAMPATWSIIPFVLLLLMIATGPLFFEHFWHHHYPKVAIGLGVIVVVYYLFFLHDSHHPIHSLAEYVSFIALIASLFIASGGILINIDKEGTPGMNIAILIFGAMIANIIGTTGASMLLIRPFMRLNKNRIKPYHIVFFIFMVSNVGGCLTPIGDPPLFLGFLKGVPFFWTVENVWGEWIVGIGLLALVFFFIDKRNKPSLDSIEEKVEYSGKFSMAGGFSIIWLVIIIISVFLDPNKIDWLPGILQLSDGTVHLGITANLTATQQEGATYFSFVRELIMFTVAILAYKTANKECLKQNEFDFEPVKEVAFIFIGIFATMMPALQLVAEFAKSSPELVSVNSLYWATGSLSGVLDNAPTYMNFLAAGMGKMASDLNEASLAEMTPANVNMYVEGAGTQWELLAISVASVFFGAMTYIGNAPNFMVKSIAEQSGIKMPAFVSYVVKYSLPILLPILGIVWLLFFVLRMDQYIR